MSLRTRFMISVIVLLTFLVGLILLAIEKREVKAIFEEQKEKGKLIAKNIAQLNLQPLLMWDREGIEENIKNRSMRSCCMLSSMIATAIPMPQTNWLKAIKRYFNRAVSGEMRKKAVTFLLPKILRLLDPAK